MADTSPGLRPKLAVLFNQPSILLLGLTTILAFIALQRFPPDDRLIIYVIWGSIFLFILLWRVLRWYLSPVTLFSEKKDVVDIYVKITGGALVLLTIFFSWINFKLTQATSEQTLKVSERTLDSSETQKISEQFTKALEDLGGESVFHHLAGIYAFRRLEQRIDSESEYSSRSKDLEAERASEAALKKYAAQHLLDIKVHREMVDVLTHFIQEASPWPEKSSGSAAGRSSRFRMVPVANASSEPEGSKPKCRVDVYETLKFLGQRKLTYGEGEPDPLNLISTDLRDCTLQSGNFNGANFTNANLTKADLKGARLWNANFDNAKLNEADFAYANLVQANLHNADLTGAVLTNVDLTGAKFKNTSMYGVDLTTVKLGKEDTLEGVFVDHTTTCPNGFEYDAEENVCRRSG
ncbi:MAG: pentapeptide repeat-containing protein [Pyrinomonadaceae bacterium]